MLQKIKHNKIKNTGILYEVLVRKIIEQSINNKPPVAYGIFNRHFKKNRELTKQLELYTLMIQTKYDTEAKAAALLQQVNQLRMGIDEVKLDREKYSCIKQLKMNYNLKRLFQVNLNTYKLYASVYKIFESIKVRDYNPLNIIEAKHQIISFMVHPINEQKGKAQQIQQFSKMTTPQKEQILQLFVQKFNEKYQTLTVKQKELLKKYAYHTSDSEQINQYMNTEIDALRMSLYEYKDNSLVTDTILQMDNIKSIKSVQDKIYAVLNLYEIERQITK